MKYPMVNNWVFYTKNGSRYKVFDDLMDKEYEMPPGVFRLFISLDGYTNPYHTGSGFSRTQVRDILRFLENKELIRNSRILEKSFGTFLITLFHIESERIKKQAKMFDYIISLLWLPVLISGFLFIINHADDVCGPDCFISGSIFGVVTGIVLHEIGHAAAGLRYGGKVFEFGIGISSFCPCAYVVMNTGSIRSRIKRAHVNAAGIEMNLFLTGMYLYLACFIPLAGGFMFFAAITNAYLAITNALFISGVDGLGIISEYIGCSNFLEYAKEMIFRRNKQKKRTGRDINGVITFVSCCTACVMQIGLPALIILQVMVFVL